MFMFASAQVERVMRGRQKKSGEVMKSMQRILREVNVAKDKVAVELAQCNTHNLEERERCAVFQRKLDNCRLLVNTAGSMIEGDILQRVEDMRMNFDQASTALCSLPIKFVPKPKLLPSIRNRARPNSFLWIGAGDDRGSFD